MLLRLARRTRRRRALSRRNVARARVSDYRALGGTPPYAAVGRARAFSRGLTRPRSAPTRCIARRWPTTRRKRSRRRWKARAGPASTDRTARRDRAPAPGIAAPAFPRAASSSPRTIPTPRRPRRWRRRRILPRVPRAASSSLRRPAVAPERISHSRFLGECVRNHSARDRFGQQSRIGPRYFGYTSVTSPGPPLQPQL